MANYPGKITMGNFCCWNGCIKYGYKYTGEVDTKEQLAR